MNSSSVQNLLMKPDHGAHEGCSKENLTDFFGWFLQVLLACLAFTCLIAKRFCEPIRERRSWHIWFYDTSKQGIGALAIHMANVWLAGQYTGDACTWYIINFLLDSSLGLFIIICGIKSAQYLARRKAWPLINFGEYGKPPQLNAWITQCILYVILMGIVKILITLFMQLNFWDSVKDFILAPLAPNPKLELAFVMLIIPFFVNILMFWVTDNFLMHRNAPITLPHYGRRDSLEDSLLGKVQFKIINASRRRRHDSENDVLLSGDDDLLDVDQHHIPKNTNNRYIDC